MITSQAPWHDGKATRLKMGRRLIGWGFVAAAIILVFCGWESYRNTMQFAQAAERQKRSDDVLRAINGTMARLVDAESQQRGYLLTGDDAYLLPYRKAIKSVGQETRDLKDLTSDNPNEQKRIQAMEPLIDKKLAEIQTTIDLRRKGEIGAATRMVLQGTGKQSMDQIRALAAEMASEEHDLLRVRTQRADESMATSARTIVAGTLVSILLLVLCFGLLNRELSERKRAQEDLGKSEKWFSTTLGSIGDAVIATDMNGVVTFMNSVAQSLTGWSLEEARGKSMDMVFDIVNKETRQPVENPVKKVFREGKVVGLADHTLLLSKDGKEFDIEDSAAPIVTGTGEDLGVVLVFRDATEQKRAEEALRQSQEQYHLLFESIPHPVWVYDLKTLAIVDVNHSAVQDYGYSREEFLSLTLKDIRPLEDIPALLENVASLLSSTESGGVWKHRKKDGTLIDVEIMSRPIIYRGGDARLVVATNITARKRAEEALQTSEQKFRSLVQTANDAIITADSHENITDFNHGAETIFGYAAREVIGKPLTVLMPDRFKEPHQRGVKRYLETREAHVIGKTVELAAKRKDGTEFPVELSLSSWKTGAGLFFTGILSDITTRKKVEEVLRQSEERFRLLVSDVTDYAILMLDPEGRIASWNAGAERIKGYRSEEIIGQHFSLFYTKEDVESGKPAYGLRVALEQGRFKDEGWRVRKDGSRFWANVVITALYDETGQLRGFGKVTRDTTEIKQAEEALKANEQRLNLALDAAQLGIWELDLVNDKAYRNLRHDQIFGYESLQPEWGQEIFLTHVVPEDREIVKKSFEKAFATGDFHMECRIVWPDKSIHWISAQGRVFRNDKGDPARMMGTVADVSERMRDQETILHAKEDAERTSKFKDQFLSTMSHELRTPLNAVLGFSDLLSEERYGPLNERQQRYVAHIHTGGKHLLRLINDILDLSKIEAGHLQLAIESVPITTSLAEVLDALRPLADKKSQSLVQHAAPDLSVRADATRFKQIVMNLLGNAIKFTPEGGKIELAAQELGEFVRVEVRDSGPGIPPGEQQRIFDAFYRLRQPDKAPEGTGLGLAITRRLVELHGGQLGLESQPGSGSCFYFTLPMAPTFQKERIRKTETTLDKSGSGRILVIEDDLVSARLIESQLASSGYDVVLWDRRRHAVEMAAELQPDAITLDIVMKPVNGWELLSNLKSHPRTATIPVIVVSIVDQPATGALLGADEYIVKPVAKEVLLAAVKHCLKHRGHREQVRPILVVDDDNATREFIAELLSKHGYVVSTAADGAEARAQVAASLPELVILDLILPEVSGFQLLADWRADSRTTDLPIFVLTSKDLTPEEKDYLLKNAGALFHKQERWQEALIRQLQRAVPPVSAGKS